MNDEDEIASMSNSNEVLSKNENGDNNNDDDEDDEKVSDETKSNGNDGNNDESYGGQVNDIFRKDGELDELKLVGSVLKTAQEKEAREKKEREKAEAASAKAALEKEAKEREKAAAKASMHQPRQLRARTAAADAAAALAAKAVADKIEMEEKAAAARNRKVGRPRKKSTGNKKDEEEKTDKAISTASKKAGVKGGKKRKESDSSSESGSESEGEDEEDDEEVEDEDEAWKPGADSKKKSKKGSASTKPKTKPESGQKPPKKKRRRRGKGYGKRGRPPKGWKPSEEFQNLSPKGGAKISEEKDDKNSQQDAKNTEPSDLEVEAEALVVEKKRVGRPRKNKGKNVTQGGGSQKKRKVDEEGSEYNNLEEGIDSTEDNVNASSDKDNEVARNESLVAAALATVEKQSSTTLGRKSPRLNKNEALLSLPASPVTKRRRRGEDVDGDVVVIVSSSPDDDGNLAAEVVRGSISPPSVDSGEISSPLRVDVSSKNCKDRNSLLDSPTGKSDDETSMEEVKSLTKEEAVETADSGSADTPKPSQSEDKKSSETIEVERPSLDNSDVVFVAVSQPGSNSASDSKNAEEVDCSDKKAENENSESSDMAESKASVFFDISSKEVADATFVSSSEVSSSSHGKLRRSTRRGVVTPPYPSPAPASVPKSEKNCDKEKVDSSSVVPVEVDNQTSTKTEGDVVQHVEEDSKPRLSQATSSSASNVLETSETTASTEGMDSGKKVEEAVKLSSTPLDTEVAERTEDSTMDDQPALGSTKDTIFRGVCKRKNKRNKTCPICRGIFASNGFYMHMTKCRKYQDWVCGFCQLKGVYSFAPHMPGPGPDGPNTLCPDCSRSWKAEMKLAMESGTVPEEVEKLLSKAKSKSKTMSLDSKAEKSSSEAVSEKAVANINKNPSSVTESQSDTLTRTKRKVIAPSRYSDEGYKGADDDGNTDEDGTSPSKFGRNANRSGGGTLLDNSLARDKMPFSGQGSDAQSAAAMKSSETNENRTMVGSSTECSSDKNDGTGWSNVEECALMIAALDNPQFMARRGPGLWMLDNGLDLAMEGKYTAREIVEQWDIMIKRCMGTRHSCLADTPAKYRATHVQSACMASELILAQNVALTFAGWLKIPPDIVDSSKLGLKLRMAKKGRSKGRWHRPSVTTRILSKLSVDDYVSSSLSIEKAWEEHLEELRRGIEEVIAPGQQLNRKSEDHVMASPGRKSFVVKEKRNVSGAMHKQSSVGMDHVWGDTVKIAGKNLIVPAHVHTMMKKRALFTREGDPRPTLLCSWCGPKWTQKKKKILASKKSKESTVPSCPACRILYEDGWRMRGSSLSTDSKNTTDYRDYTYTDPSGSIHRSVKAFLTATTKYIAKKFGDNSDDSNSVSSGSDDEVGTVNDHDGNVRENDDVPLKESTDEIYEARLPSIQQLYNEREGLMGVLKADEFCAMNSRFGSDSNIALMVLQSLATGKLPGWVQYETPFLRSEEELAVLGNYPPTRFLGVTRLMEERQIVDGGRKRVESRPTGKFGVEFPVFVVDYETFGSAVEGRSSSGDTKGRSLPICATIGGRKVFLRTDIPREDIAGQLFSFIYRILYGRQAADDVRAQTNALHSRAGFVIDTLRAFGASKVDLKK